MTLHRFHNAATPKMMHKILAFLFLVFTILSCNKDKAVLDVLGPEIRIISPADQSVFTSGSEIDLVIEIEENLGLHSYFIWLIDSATNYPSLIDKGHLHTTSAMLNTKYDLSEVSPGAYEILVQATDHDVNTTEESIHIKIN